MSEDIEVCTKIDVCLFKRSSCRKQIFSQENMSKLPYQMLPPTVSRDAG